MKKRYILFFCLLTFIFSNVYASTLVQDLIKDVWYFRKGGGKKAFSAKFYYYSLDGKTAYCIEPGMHITTDNYNDLEGLSNSPYSDDINERLQLIGYYGYDYPGHNTVKYRMATQALIWELTGGQTVEFWTEKSGGGTFISIRNEKNEIMNLVNNHPRLPSFNNEIKNSYYKETIVFEDTYNVLDNYELTNNLDVASINDNKLIINNNRLDNYEINLRRKSFATNNTTIFIGVDNESQKMGYFGINSEEKIKVSVNSKLRTKLKIIKKDYDTLKIIDSNDFYFIIKNNSNEIIYEGNTVNGILTTTSFLDEGNYIIEEKEFNNIPNYLWNKEPLEIRIDNSIINTINDELIYEIEFYNRKPKGELEINKTGEISKYYNNDELLNDITFDLFNGKNELVNTIVIKNGYAKIDNLSLGNYYLVEKNTLNKYLLDNNPIKFSIDYIDSYTSIINKKINIDNKLKKGKFILLKIDKDTLLPISNVLINIYNDYFNISEYTNELGLIEIDDLPIGEYKYKEIKSKEGYLTNEEEYTFEIKEDGEIVNKTITNEMVKGSIIINKIDSDNFEGLEGIEFQIYDQDNNLVCKDITNSDGKLEINNLKYGDYTYKEVNTPVGYLNNDTIYEFSIKKNNDIIENTIVNEKIHVPNTLSNEININYLGILFSIVAILIKHEKIIS